MKLPDGVIERPDGLWELVVDSPEAERLMDRVHHRIPGTKTWIRRQGTVEKVKSFISAVTSSYVEDAEYERRRAICYAPCPALTGDWCGACG